MTIPDPTVLVARASSGSPEQIAHHLGFRVRRQQDAPLSLPGVTILSEYQADGLIILYQSACTREAARRGVPVGHLEQYLIAHELYHGLAERAGRSLWTTPESDADHWAEALLVACGIDVARDTA